MSLVRFRDTIGRTGRLRMRQLRVGDVVQLLSDASLETAGGAAVPTDTVEVKANTAIRLTRVSSAGLEGEAKGVAVLDGTRGLRYGTHLVRIDPRAAEVRLHTDDTRLVGRGDDIPHAE